MDMSSINMRLLLTGFVFINSVYPLTLRTEDVIFQESDSIILNCTYHKESMEDISNRDIRWKKLIGDRFEDLAIFSPPGGQEPFILWDKEPLYRNRTELITPNTSLSAVMIIRDPICSDQGIYRCQIEYFIDGPRMLQKSSVVTFKAKPTAPEEFLVFPKELEENQSIALMCSADVGSPQGTIKIWKFVHYYYTTESIYLSNTTTNKTENCTEIIKVATTYSVNRYDNGAVFRCSSQNNLTQGPWPYRESSKISVIYGPDEPAIHLTPSKYLYFVGDFLTINCITESNPPPVFTWKFQPHNKSLETVIKHSPDISKLVFDSLQATDSGTYSCTATNVARTNSLNVTTFVSLYVRHSESSFQGCNLCGYFKVCQQYNGKTECVTNKWVPIAVVFIVISVSFAAASIVLIKNKRQRPKCITYSSTVLSQSAQQDEGGYQTHTEFVNTHIYSGLQSHQPENGVYTSLQSPQPENGVYTSLQSQQSQTGEYTSLQSHQPETGVYTSLQSHQPETGVYTLLHSQQSQTGGYTSLQSHRPETGGNTSLQSNQTETLQSQRPETGEYTSIDNVS